MSPNMVPIDRLGMVSYYCHIETLSVRRTVFEIFDLSITTVMGHSRSLDGHVLIRHL